MAEIATKTAFYTADRTRVVGEDDADAAFLLARAGSPLDGMSEADRQAYDDFAAGSVEEAAEYDAVADHAAKHGGETDEQAQARRQAMLEGQPDPDGPPVAGERGNLDAKAVSAPPANKAETNPSGVVDVEDLNDDGEPVAPKRGRK